MRGTTAAAVVGAALAIVVILVALRLGSFRHAQQPEDPLVLYQLARELQRSGQSEAALATLDRARQVAHHVRSRRQIDELRLEIEVQPALARAQAHIEAGGLVAARKELSWVLSRDPTNERASLLMQWLQDRAAKPGRPAKLQTNREPTRTQEVAASPTVPRELAVGDTSSRRTKRRRAAHVQRRAHPGPESARTTQAAGPSVVARPSGSVNVRSNVVSWVHVDGQDTQQQTPVTLSAQPGKHTITIVSVSDPTVRLLKSVVVERGQVAEVRFQVVDPSPSRSKTERQGPSTDDEARVTPPPTDNINPWR